MAAQIFDDLGGVWSDNSEEFRRSFAPVYSQGGTGDYVARALGFVVVDRFGPSIHMRFAPERVSDRALVRAFEWIKTLKYARLSLGLYTNRWHFKLCANVDNAKAYAADMIGEFRAAAPPALVARGHDAGRLERGSAMHQLITDWVHVRGVATEANAVTLGSRHLGSRFVLTETDADSNQLIFKAVGTGFDYYGPDWPRSVLGKPVDCQPDPNYARWVVETYEAALRSGQPMLQDVDALITTRGGVRARLRIRRAVLPMTGQDGRKFVVGGSVYDDHIDLRFTPNAEAVTQPEDNLGDIEIARSRLVGAQRARAQRVNAPV